MIERGKFIVIKEDDNNTRSSEPDLIIGILQTNEILRVTDQYDRSNYTFSLTSIESNDTTTKSFFNLVIKETSVGLFSFITEYRPDRNWLPNYRNLQDFTSFTGDIFYYSIEGEFNAKVTLNSGQLMNIDQRSCEGDTGNTGNNGGNDDNTDGNTDGNTTDGNTTDGNTTDGNTDGNSGDGDWVLVCEQVIIVIDSNACGGDPCGISFEHCVVQPQNIVIPPDDNNIFRNPCLPDNSEVCHEPNGDPCPSGCNADGTGCLEETDSNPTIGVFLDIIFDSESWTEEYNCQRGTVRDMHNISSPITDLFQDIFGENPDLDVTFFVNPSFPNYGETNTSDFGDAAITFGDPFIFSTDLLMATVTVHEIFHANLQHIYFTLNNDSDPNNDLVIEGLIGNPSYGQLINVWATSQTNGSPTAQHNYIADYKDTIAQAVYDWATTPEPLGGGYDPNDETLQEYLQDLAWIGLQESSAWETFENDPNNADEVMEIQSIFAQETSPYQHPNEKGTPCE